MNRHTQRRRYAIAQAILVMVALFLYVVGTQRNSLATWMALGAAVVSVIIVLTHLDKD